MRAALLILALFPLCLIITGCASNPDAVVIKPAHKPQTPKPLPDQFIAVWNHDRPYDMLLEIKKNGWIIEKKRSTGEVTNKYQYKLAYLENPRSAYILVKEPYEYMGKKRTKYIYRHLKIDIIYNAHRPERIEFGHGCYSEDDEEWNITTEEFIRRSTGKTDKCNPMSIRYYTAFYRDKLIIYLHFRSNGQQRKRQR